MQILNLKDTLNDLTVKINDFLSPYTKEPAFWVILAIILLAPINKLIIKKLIIINITKLKIFPILNIIISSNTYYINS